MTHHLAQINIGRFLADKDDPANADFMAALDAVNAHADVAPGFVWRLIGEDGNATDVEVDAADPRLIVNMSLWTSLEALADFTYRHPDHLAVMRRRREWFEKIETFMALWWVPAGHVPTVAEGMERIAHLAEHGPSGQAFTFRQPFAPPEGAAPRPVLETCD
jgi:hypothetical protein